MAPEERKPAAVIVMPIVHAYRPYRSADLVTGEATTLDQIPRRVEDDPPAETLEIFLRRLRELCRLEAYVGSLESAVSSLSNGQEFVQKHADASRALEFMFRRAARDLDHVSRYMPTSISNWQPPPQREDEDDD